MEQPIYENIRFSANGGTFTDKLRLESKTDVSSDDVERILDVTAFVSLTEKEVINGKIKYGGNVIYQIFYQDKSGMLRKYECGNEYLGVIEDDKISDACSVAMTAKPEKVEADTSGLKVSVSATLAVSATLYACQNLSAISGGEGLVVNKKDFEIVKGYGLKSSAYPVEEEFVIDFPVKEVLTHSVKGVVTNVQCGVGCIIADGEVIVTALVLAENRDGEIIKQTKTLPFRMEIEYDEAMPAMRATARVSEKSFKSDISVDGETGKSTVNLFVTLLFEGEAFSDESVTLATDAFDLAENVEIIREDFCAVKPCEMRSYAKEISGRAQINELPVDATLMAVGGENAEIAKITKRETCVVVDGVLSAVGFFKDGENKSFSVKMEIPFTVELENFNCPDAEVDVVATVRGSGARIVSLTETELNGEIYFTVYPMEKHSIQYIKEIKPCGEKQKETSAISVYIPLEGEELWSLAKRLNVCPDELVATNKELQFPLTGKERIVIYRQMC